MNRMIRLMSAVMLVGGLAACHDDPTVPLTNKEPDRIQASPQVMFVTQNATKELLLRLVDDANYSTPTGPYTVTNVAAGLTVVWDSMYRPDYVGSDSLTAKPVKSQHRYFVKSTTAQATSFTVAAGAISQVITVNVVASTLGDAVSTTAPAIGDPVTLTAPGNLSFSVDTSEVTVGGDDVVVTDMTAKSITFVPFPGSSGKIEVTGVHTDYLPTIAVQTLETDAEIVVPPAPLPTLNKTAPAIGESVTVTAGPGEAFNPDATVSFPEGGGDAVILSQTATTITFIPIPGSTGPATVDGVMFTAGQGALLGSFALQTSNEIEVAAVTNAPATVSTATPTLGQAVTVTLTGFKFIEGATITIGGKSAAITSISADSTSAVVVPLFGSSGAVAFTNIALASLLKVPLNVPSDGKVITVGAGFGGSTLPGGTDISNAPEITLPSKVGVGAAVTDMGSFGTYATCVGSAVQADSCRIYKIVVPAAQTYDFVLAQNGAADLGLVLLNSTGGSPSTIADALGQTATPETGSKALTAGTYYLAVVFFDYGAHPPLPTVIQLFLNRTK